MDEATASIDSATDKLIHEMLQKHFQECTVLVIAHRLETILDSDMIMVLDKGKLVEYDTPSALLKNSSSLFTKSFAQT